MAKDMFKVLKDYYKKYNIDEIECPDCGGTKFHKVFAGKIIMNTRNNGIIKDELDFSGHSWMCEICDGWLETDVEEELEKRYKKIVENKIK